MLASVVPIMSSFRRLISWLCSMSQYYAAGRGARWLRQKSAARALPAGTWWLQRPGQDRTASFCAVWVPGGKHSA